MSSEKPEALVVDLLPRCGKCLQHFFEHPTMIEACASVGIEHGKSTGQMLKEWYAIFHKRKHQVSA